MEKHHCDIKYLLEGTKKLIEEVNNNQYDYFYVTCKNCNNNEEYFHENFIYCQKCDKHFCNICDIDLVSEIHSIIKNNNICNCDISNHIKCGLHYYCELCKIPDCSKCQLNSDSEDYDHENCPFCYKSLKYDDENYCEFHYGLLELKNCIKCNIIIKHTYHSLYCNNCYYDDYC